MSQGSRATPAPQELRTLHTSWTVRDTTRCSESKAWWNSVVHLLAIYRTRLNVYRKENSMNSPPIVLTRNPTTITKWSGRTNIYNKLWHAAATTLTGGNLTDQFPVNSALVWHALFMSCSRNGQNITECPLTRIRWHCTHRLAPRCREMCMASLYLCWGVLCIYHSMSFPHSAAGQWHRMQK